MKTSLCGLACLLLACGGKQQVNLGDSDDSSGWANTQLSPAAATDEPAPTVAAHEVQTVYDSKETVTDVAVDDTTIAALISNLRQYETRLEMCRFEDCKRTRQIIERFPWVSAGLISTAVWILISHGEVLWLEFATQTIGNAAAPTGLEGTIVDHTGSDGLAVPDSGLATDRTGILACSTAGCPQGPRRISAATPAWPHAFVADAENVYWLTTGNVVSSEQWQVARCARSGCQAPDFVAVPDAVAQDFYGVFASGPAMVIDEAHRTLYISTVRGIIRVPTDFSASPTLFHQDSSSLGGIAVVGDYVYFARSTMLGEILRCPVTGCDAGPELVSSAPRWPSRLVADERALYWLNKAPTNAIAPGSGSEKGDSDIAEISGVSLGGAAQLVTLMGGLRTGSLSSNCAGPVINSHHLYWCEVTGSAGSELTLNIRSMQR